MSDFLDKLEEKLDEDEEEADAHDVTDALGDDAKYWDSRNKAKKAQDALDEEDED